MIKRFLVPVLALAAFGLPAGASVVAYCDGGGCGANTMAAFNSLTSGLGSGSQSTFSAGNITVEGSGLYQYLDPATGLLFIDESYNSLSLVGSALQVGASTDSAQIAVPTGVTSFVVSISALGSGQNYVVDGITAFLSTTPTQFGFIDASGNIGNLAIQHNSGGPLIFNDFNAAGGAGQSSDTPEVGTLLLIGAGLISMRWMKRLPKRFAKPRLFHSPRTV